MPEFKPISLVRQRLKKKGHPVYAGETLSHIYGSTALELLRRYEQQNWAGGAVLPANLSVIGAELVMVTHDRPYFKVYPEFVGPLSDTGLNVPVEYCKLPYTSFEIRLPREQQIPVTLGSTFVLRGKEVLVSVYALMVYTEDAAFTAIIAAMQDFSDAHRLDVGHLVRVAKDLQGANKRGLNNRGISDIISISMHCNPVDPNTQLYTPNGVPQDKGANQIGAFFPLIEGLTIEESLAKADMSDEVMKATNKVLRLALAVSFLATGHDRLIEPDVLSKHLDKFSSPDATEETIEELHVRATKKRGEGKGYTLGRRERLLRVAQARNEGMSEEEARHLKHQHQRGGHIHRYHKGGKLIYKWIPQLTVRPDLPVDERGSAGIVLK